jgi:glycerophosphoryl diester phosphodiesterase
MHKKGLIVGVWLDKTSAWNEDEHYFQTIYDLGVDMVTTDYPEIAHKQLIKIHQI